MIIFIYTSAVYAISIGYHYIGSFHLRFCSSYIDSLSKFLMLLAFWASISIQLSGHSICSLILINFLFCCTDNWHRFVKIGGQLVRLACPSGNPGIHWDCNWLLFIDDGNIVYVYIYWNKSTGHGGRDVPSHCMCTCARMGGENNPFTSTRFVEGAATNVWLILTILSGGQYKLGGLRDTRGRLTPYPTNRALPF